MLPDFKANHFELFGLPTSFGLNMTALETAYRNLQSKVHPDKFAHLAEAEKRASMQWSTRVNEAWQTLRAPLQRSVYLLTLQGIDALAANNTHMSPSFLMQQIEWREAIEHARVTADKTALQHIEQTIQQAEKSWQQQLLQQFDQLHDYQAATQTVRQLKFIDKLSDEINDIWAELDM